MQGYARVDHHDIQADKIAPPHRDPESLPALYQRPKYSSASRYRCYMGQLPLLYGSGSDVCLLLFSLTAVFCAGRFLQGVSWIAF